MKKLFLRFISLVLVIALLLPSITESMVSYSVFASSINDDEATEEAKKDAEEPVIRAGKWSQAHYKDGLPWNHFHNSVQEYIVAKYNGMGKERPYGNGRADLYRDISDDNATDYLTTYIWELKPGSYLKPNKMEEAESQLKRYINAPPKNPNIKNAKGDLNRTNLCRQHKKPPVGII